MSLHEEFELTKFHTQMDFVRLCRDDIHKLLIKPCGCMRFPGEHDLSDWFHAAMDYLRFRPYFQRFRPKETWNSIGGVPLDSLFPDGPTNKEFLRSVEDSFSEILKNCDKESDN